MPSGNKLSRCKGCDALVFFVSLKSGKSMPCDAEMFLVDTSRPRDAFVVGTAVINGTRVSLAEAANVTTSALAFGSISHFATCKQADMFRRKRR